MELVGQLSYPERLNDIWGYVAPDGTEYALVGTRLGTSIVSLADPANPLEVAKINGDESVWRDLKTWNNYAYVTTDSPSEDGLLVIDLSDLPNEVSSFNWNPHLPDLSIGTDEDTLFNCHNIYIDEFGIAYLSGCNLNEGGVIMVDVATTPGQPIYVGATEAVYSHDAYTRNNLLYSSEILEGRFSIFDVTDKLEPIKLGERKTPFEFCHNAWLSDDGNTLYTTDERANAFTAAYDVSNPADIRFLDAYRPAATLGTGVIPHNVHVLGDYLVISHYSDGCVIVDATKPDNLVEVGQYDTFQGTDSGFNGDWGAYPFLPSGLILASDITGGLFVLQPTFQRAAYLEGKVTNSETGVGILDAEVTIQSDIANFETTDIVGNYKTGLVENGILSVRFKAIGFYDKIAEATLENGEITVLNVELDPLPQFVFNGKVVDEFNQNPLEGAVILMEGTEVNYETQTDADGNFVIPDIFEGDYTLYLGIWGYENIGLSGQSITGESSKTFELKRIYEDNFNVDLGWQVSNTTDRGEWVREVPLGTTWNDEPVQAAADTEDFGNRCWVTRNGEIDGKSGDIDNGETTITTPNMDLTTYFEPTLSYRPWFVNLPIDDEFRQRDSMFVTVNNGIEEVVVEVIEDSRGEWREARSFKLSDYLEITDSMTVSFTAFDRFLTDDIADAGLDDFRVSDEISQDVFVFDDENVQFGVFPNPFQNELTIAYQSKFPFSKMEAILYNAVGQKIGVYPLTDTMGKIEINDNLAVGMYFLIMEIDGIRSEALPIQKGI
jgi:choice-of-anchor B domain-containing protein